ncbi:GntR family transcriptional regulator [Aquabacterium humicola]|uniref:GntR family transcriptional regulator n=1 Tax=Aquabacterium humicola TaxID=3237377 RepID=UPI00254382FF|nr:GntR family transcriptional regulator [Rubrivivax pictus]
MRSTSFDLDQFLDELARDARPGDRLPTIRELMRRFGASQMLVQRAFQNLKARGLIESQVGRGTYFVGRGGPATAADAPRPATASTERTRQSGAKSVLLLRRSISIARGRVLVEGLQRRLAAEGHRVLELSYSDPEHALAALKGLPRFDACVVQSTFKTIPIGLLAALRDKSEVLAVDGAALVGTDVEAVGTEWGEPLAAAVALLRQHGHRRIAYASTTHPFLATQLGRRRFETLRRTLPELELHEVDVPGLPDGDYARALVEQLKAALGAGGQLPFSALVAWGIEDGARFRSLLAEAGLPIPAALSVVLLGRTDLPNEHADFFHTVGCSVADQVDALNQVLHARWADPSAPYGVRLTPVTARAGASVAAPAKAAAERSRARPSRP